MINGRHLGMTDTGGSLFIVGIGNTLRSDDGIGDFICRELSCLPLKNTEISFALQLNTEWLEIFLAYDTVIMVDARADGDQQVRFEPVQPDQYLSSRTSHYLDASTLSALITGLLGSKPSLLVCSVRGYDFSIGEGLSPRGMTTALEALRVLRRWLTENGYLAPD
jgi:hydrogenase maturation protease